MNLLSSSILSNKMAYQHRDRRCFSESYESEKGVDIPRREPSGMENQQRSHSSPNLYAGRIEEEALFDLSPPPLDLSERGRNSEGHSTVSDGYTGTLQIPDGRRGVVENRQPVRCTPHHEYQLSENKSLSGRLAAGDAACQPVHVQPTVPNLSEFLDEILDIDESCKENCVGHSVSQALRLNSVVGPGLATSCVHSSLVSYTAPTIAAPNISWSDQSSVIYSPSNPPFENYSYYSNVLDYNHNMNYGYGGLPTPTHREPSRTTTKNNPSVSSSYSGHFTVDPRREFTDKSKPSCSHAQGGKTPFDDSGHRKCMDPSVRAKRLPTAAGPSDIQRDRVHSADYSLYAHGGLSARQKHIYRRKLSRPAGPTDGPTEAARFDRGKSLVKGNNTHKLNSGHLRIKTDPNSSTAKYKPPKPPDDSATSRHEEGAKALSNSPASTSSVKRAGAIKKEEAENINSTPIDPRTNPGPKDTTMLPTFEEEFSGILSQLEQLQDMELFQQEQYSECSVYHPDMIATKTEVPSPQGPVTLPGHDLVTPDESLMELENYYYSMPSPASTVVSEEMNEAYEIVMEDILTSVIQSLRISADPTQWTVEHVQAWVSLLLREYGRHEVDMCNFRVNGYSLCQMSQEELEQRAADNGYLIFSNLQCLVKNIQRDDVKPVISAYQQQQYMEQQQQQQQIHHHSHPHGMVPPQMTYDPADLYFQYVTPSVGPVSPAMRSERDMSPSPSASSSDEEEPSLSPSGPNTSMTPHHTGAIQLWQFLQELLIQPDSYNYCIRFLDRSQGIFKIEDSVEVARLWGMRKNRPAMNYDKLSRSIRQYYKKKIMKKTDISQRLVYQFVKPF